MHYIVQDESSHVTFIFTYAHTCVRDIGQKKKKYRQKKDSVANMQHKCEAFVK